MNGALLPWTSPPWTFKHLENIFFRRWLFPQAFQGPPEARSPLPSPSVQSAPPCFAHSAHNPSSPAPGQFVKDSLSSLRSAFPCPLTSWLLVFPATILPCAQSSRPAFPTIERNGKLSYNLLQNSIIRKIEESTNAKNRSK